MRIVYGFLLLLTFTSCLKKIDAVETANTNIYDPEYAGDQWFIYDDVFTYTNSNNDQKIRIEFIIPESYAPQIQPTVIEVSVIVNGAAPVIVQAPIASSGNYEGAIELFPTGQTNFCIELGVYVEEEQLTLNSFSECKSL